MRCRLTCCLPRLPDVPEGRLAPSLPSTLLHSPTLDTILVPPPSHIPPPGDKASVCISNKEGECRPQTPPIPPPVKEEGCSANVCFLLDGSKSLINVVRGGCGGAGVSRGGKGRVKRHASQ